MGGGAGGGGPVASTARADVSVDARRSWRLHVRGEAILRCLVSGSRRARAKVELDLASVERMADVGVDVRSADRSLDVV